MRNPRRTASTASALMIGLGLVAMVAILSASLKASFDAALEDTLRADLVLTSSSFTAVQPGGGDADRRRSTACETVSQFRQGGFQVNDSDAAMTGVDPATIEAGREPRTERRSHRSRSATATCWCTTRRCEDNGWAVGDSSRRRSRPIGDDPLTIGGTFDDNRLVGGLRGLARHLRRTLPGQLDTFVFVKTADGADLGHGPARTSRRPRPSSATSRCRTRPRSASSRRAS